MNLSSLPEHVALKVIRNCRPEILPPNGRLYDRLDEAFTWSETLEGHQYWNGIHRRLRVLTGTQTSNHTEHALLP